jgi:hypothetical protein
VGVNPIVYGCGSLSGTIMTFATDQLESVRAIQVMRDMAKIEMDENAPPSPTLHSEPLCMLVTFPSHDPAKSFVYKSARAEYEWAVRRLRELDNGGTV